MTHSLFSKIIPALMLFLLVPTAATALPQDDTKSPSLTGEGPRPRYSPTRNHKYYNKKLTDAQKQMLKPAPEVEAAFKELLRQPNTGLVRLLPGGKHEFNYTVSATEDPDSVLPIPGGGAFYSFTHKTHKLGPWSEVTWQKGHLFVGFAFETLGLLTALGDVPIESVTLETPGVQFLAGYVPPTLYKDAKTENARELKGVQADGFTYAAIFKAVPNMTYVMRSVAYRKAGRVVVSFTPVYVPHPFEYEGVDTLIAFRVVRIDKDGSVTLAWKRLKKYPTPKMKDKG